MIDTIAGSVLGTLAGAVVGGLIVWAFCQLLMWWDTERAMKHRQEHSAYVAVQRSEATAERFKYDDGRTYVILPDINPETLTRAERHDPGSCEYCASAL